MPSIRFYGDSLLTDVHNHIIIEGSHIVGGSRLVPGAVDPETGQDIKDLEWSPMGGELWQTNVLGNPIPDVAVVSLLQNDLWLANKYVPGMGSYGRQPFSIKPHINAFLDGMTNVGVERVLWCTPPRSPRNLTREACLNVYLAILRDVAQSTSMELVEFDKYLSAEAHFDPTGYAATHPKASALSYIAELILSKVDNG